MRFHVLTWTFDIFTSSAMDLDVWFEILYTTFRHNHALVHFDVSGKVDIRLVDNRTGLTTKTMVWQTSIFCMIKTEKLAEQCSLHVTMAVAMFDVHVHVLGSAVHGYLESCTSVAKPVRFNSCLRHQEICK